MAMDIHETKRNLNNKSSGVSLRVLHRRRREGLENSSLVWKIDDLVKCRDFVCGDNFSSDVHHNVNDARKVDVFARDEAMTKQIKVICIG